MLENGLDGRTVPGPLKRLRNKASVDKSIINFQARRSDKRQLIKNDFIEHRQDSNLPFIHV